MNKWKSEVQDLVWNKQFMEYEDSNYGLIHQ